MTYDAAGQRFTKAMGTTRTTYVAGLYEKRATSSGTSHVFHVGGPEGPVADITYTASGQSTGYLHTDRLGSVTAVAPDTGSAAQRFHYEPFAPGAMRTELRTTVPSPPRATASRGMSTTTSWV